MGCCFEEEEEEEEEEDVDEDIETIRDEGDDAAFDRDDDGRCLAASCLMRSFPWWYGKRDDDMELEAMRRGIT